MNAKLVYCSTNAQNKDIVDVTVIENGQPIHGQVRAENIIGWLRSNGNLKNVGSTGTGAGHAERKTA